MMNNFPNDLEDIEKYLMGKMSLEEKDSFEKKMKEDEFFAEQVNIHKDVLTGINAHFQGDLKDQLQQIEESYRNKTIFNIPDKIFYSIAASFILLLVAGILFFQVKDTSDALYAQYMKPYPNVVNPITRSEDEAPEDELAYQYYEIGDYESAINIFKEQLKKDPDNPSVRFYLALSHLMSENSKAAIENLQTVLSTTTRFSEPAQWYLGLSYLALDKEQKAEDIFEKIANSSSAYRSNARKILDEL